MQILQNYGIPRELLNSALISDSLVSHYPIPIETQSDRSTHASKIIRISCQGVSESCISRRRTHSNPETTCDINPAYAIAWWNISSECMGESPHVICPLDMNSPSHRIIVGKLNFHVIFHVTASENQPKPKHQHQTKNYFQTIPLHKNSSVFCDGPCGEQPQRYSALMGISPNGGNIQQHAGHLN